MNFNLSIDIGGTFTDLVVNEATHGTLGVFKSPTTPYNYVDGMLKAMEKASSHFNLSVEEFLNKCDSFVHGSTIGTNAIVQGNVAKTGLICTKGFRHILTMREGGKSNPYNWKLNYPKPYVPINLTLPVTERINSEGEIEVSLDEEEVKEVIAKFKIFGVEAIAVSLLWSIVNPKHEIRIGEIIKEEWPDIPFSLSHEVNPAIREYRRTSSTVIDASLKPIIRNYMKGLAHEITKKGYKKDIFSFNSSGGVMPIDEIVEKPIYSVDCGPALAPIGGLYYALNELQVNNLVVTDMGGTTFDITCITNGEIAISREEKIGADDYILGINKVDSRSIGAGGGSIAWIDSGGMLKVGPQSAGSMPGPVCYGYGGMNPTVTDANVVLGYIDPNYFLGGEMKLNSKLAEKFILEKVGNYLGLDAHETAYSIWHVANTNMMAAIQDILTWQGIDPSDYIIVAGGGAAGLHIASIAEGLGIRKILIPKAAGTLSAAGGIFGDIRSDFGGSHFTETNRFDFEGVNALLADLEQQANDFFEKTGVAKENRKLDFFVESRYSGQVWEIPVSLRRNRISNSEELNEFINDFHQEHEKIFAINEPGQNIECLNWTVKAIGKINVSTLGKVKKGDEDSSIAIKSYRNVYFKELGGFIKIPIYNGELLLANNKITGPAIIEEETTTILVPKNAKASVTNWGSYLLELEVK